MRVNPRRSSVLARLPCLAMLAVTLAPSPAVHATTADVDILPFLQSARIARLGVTEALDVDNASLARDMLVDPSSPYSAPIDAPSFMNDVDWPELAASLPGAMDDAAILAVLRWDLGMTRARPGVDVPPGPGFRDPFVAASARKADVDPAIFWHMLDLLGYRHSTKAAVYVVGLEILRRQLETVPKDQQEAHGVDGAVYERVMGARNAESLSPHDLRYLSTLVQYRLLHWQGGGRTAAGLRQLPVAYRVARVAAAYRDTEGYFAAPPCLRDGSPAPRVAGTGSEGDSRPLCFVAATDRAVHRWYVDEARREAAWKPPRQHEGGLMHLVALAGLMMPLLEVAALLEVVEATVADDLVASESIATTDAEFASGRADLLTCHLPE